MLNDAQLAQLVWNNLQNTWNLTREHLFLDEQHNNQKVPARPEMPARGSHSTGMEDREGDGLQGRLRRCATKNKNWPQHAVHICIRYTGEARRPQEGSRSTLECRCRRLPLLQAAHKQPRDDDDIPSGPVPLQVRHLSWLGDAQAAKPRTYTSAIYRSIRTTCGSFSATCRSSKATCDSSSATSATGPSTGSVTEGVRDDVDRGNWHQAQDPLSHTPDI